MCKYFDRGRMTMYVLISGYEFSQNQNSFRILLVEFDKLVLNT